MKTAQDEAYYEKFNFSEAPKIATQPPGPKAKAILNRQKKGRPQCISLSPSSLLGAGKGFRCHSDGC